MCRYLESVANDRDWLDYTDVQKMFSCGESVARKTIREVRNYCGYAPLPKGKIFISEYVEWRDRQRGTK